MRLAMRTDYALRVLMYLAVSEDGLTPVADIAHAYGISGHHLTKVAQMLAAAGYIETVRGRHGGIQLIRHPLDIVVGDVVCDCEPDFMLVECFQPHGQCAIERPCRLKHALADAAEAFLRELDGITLADLVRTRRPLQVSLGLTG